MSEETRRQLSGVRPIPTQWALWPWLGSSGLEGNYLSSLRHLAGPQMVLFIKIIKRAHNSYFPLPVFSRAIWRLAGSPEGKSLTLHLLNEFLLSWLLVNQLPYASLSVPNNAWFNMISRWLIHLMGEENLTFSAPTAESKAFRRATPDSGCGHKLKPCVGVEHISLHGSRDF